MTACEPSAVEVIAEAWSTWPVCGHRSPAGGLGCVLASGHTTGHVWLGLDGADAIHHDHLSDCD